jgi:hypothetical protein
MLFILVLAAACGMTLYMVWPRVLNVILAPPNTPLTQLAYDAIQLGFVLMPSAFMLAIAWFVGVSMLRTVRTAFRVTPASITALHADGRAVTIPWADARRVRDRLFAAVVESRTGDTITMPLGPASFVLSHHARGGPAPTLRQERRDTRRPYRRTLIFAVISSQVAGVIAGALAWMTPGAFPHHPFVMYASVAYGLPLILGLSMLQAPLERWLLRLSARRKRRFRDVRVR